MTDASDLKNISGYILLYGIPVSFVIELIYHQKYPGLGIALLSVTLSVAFLIFNKGVKSESKNEEREWREEIEEL